MDGYDDIGDEFDWLDESDVCVTCGRHWLDCECV